MLIKIRGGSIRGIEAVNVTVEVNVGSGMKYYIVGLPDAAIRESFQRIEAALKNNGLRMPRQKIVVNLAPADLKKEGTSYDLSIAAGILAASGQLQDEGLSEFLIMGELSLDGQLQPIRGILPLAILAKKEGLRGIIVPAENAYEAAAVSGLNVFGLNSIKGLMRFFNSNTRIPFVPKREQEEEKHRKDVFDFSDVRGQHDVKRAMEIAAAGRHNMLMIGPPGSGKTMLAKRFAGILPDLSLDESLETTRIHSVAGYLKNRGKLLLERPFRAPHHTVTEIGLAGGGVDLKPGEISLAHHGVLFLDELPEFKRSALEVLRQPLEERTISITRSRNSVVYPAAFTLLASMNPCPCGYYGHPDRLCICAPGAVQSYLGRISGPLLDRIDLQIQVAPVSFEGLNSIEPEEKSAAIKERVERARAIQRRRNSDGEDQVMRCNGDLGTKELRSFCRLDQSSLSLMKTAMEKLGLSARAYDRILKVSRTIADLESQNLISAHHIAEAIQYRSLDRSGWARSF